MNVVIYARYSCSNQTEQSIEGQIKVCTEFAEKNNLNIIGEYIDRAISGTTDNRPNFLKMIEDSKKGNFNGVLVYRLDRFSRDKYDSALYKSNLKKNGVKVISATENISDDPTGILLESLIEGMNQFYSAELSQKVKRGMDLNASKCLYNGGSVPLGYKINKDKRYEIDQKTAPFIKIIFDMYLNNYSIQDICTFLEERNIKSSRGNSLKHNTIKRILNNKNYIGIYTYKETETKGGIPQIIDEVIFYKAQEKMSNTGIRNISEYLLSSKLFCSLCEDNLIGKSGKSHTNKKYTYYYCDCNKRYIPSTYLEDLIVSKTREILTEKNIQKIANAIVTLAEKQNNQVDIKDLEKQIKKLEEQKQNLFDSLKICTIDNVKEDIFNEISKVNSKINELNYTIQKESIKKENITIPQVTFFLNEMKNGNINDYKYRKFLVTTLINKIYLHEDSVTIIFNTQNKQVDIKLPSIKEIEGSTNCQMVSRMAIDSNLFCYTNIFIYTFKL